MTPEQLAASLIAECARYRPEHPGVMVPDPLGVWVDHRRVLAALARAMGPDDLVERLQSACNCNFPETTCGAEDQCRLSFEAAARIAALSAVKPMVKKADPNCNSCGGSGYIWGTRCNCTEQLALPAAESPADGGKGER